MGLTKEQRQETLVYILLWGILFIAPVLSLYVRTAATAELTFDWNEVLMVWRQYGIYFAAFLVHNYLLAPLFVFRQRRVLYFSAVASLIVGITLCQCSFRPPAPFGKPPMADGRHVPPRPKHQPHPKHKPKPKRPPVLGERDIVQIVVLILMLGMNIGVKLYFRQRHDQQALEELEKRNLEQQLEYLKYQVNPHFLMNTLNNIHALVDINPEQAKDTIRELSKLLRFVLYEGNKQTVPLSRELAFIECYIRLMLMRYTEKVTVTIDIPERLPDSNVPPLLFITFVENAFKHGVSYRTPSYVDIAFAHTADQLHFTCRNSKVSRADTSHGGIGLTNAKQRLDLLYGKGYTLNIEDTAENYRVALTIPL